MVLKNISIMLNRISGNFLKFFFVDMQQEDCVVRQFTICLESLIFQAYRVMLGFEPQAFCEMLKLGAQNIFSLSLITQSV